MTAPSKLRVPLAIICFLASATTVHVSAPRAGAAESEILAYASGTFPSVGSVSFRTSGVYRCDRFLSQYFLWDNFFRRRHSDEWNDDYPTIPNENNAYEHEAQFEEDPGNYEFTDVQNLPNYYMDTDFDDPEGQFSRAAGSFDSNDMVHDVLYHFSLGLRTDDPFDCQTVEDQTYHVASQASYRNGPCVPNEAFCVTAHQGWPRDLVPRSAAMHGDQSGGYVYLSNALQNPSFEDGLTHWSAAAPPGGILTGAVQSGDSIEELNRFRFNCGNTVAGCAVFQSVAWPVEAEDLFTFEIDIRCVSSFGTTCPVRLAIGANGSTAPEIVTRNISVPMSSLFYWYELSIRDVSPHDVVVVAVYNDSAIASIDVDGATLHWSDTL